LIIFHVPDKAQKREDLIVI